MNYKNKWIALLTVFAVFIMLLCSAYGKNDPPKNIRIITSNNEDPEKIEYLSVNLSGKTETTGPFTPDHAAAYTVDTFCSFSTKIKNNPVKVQMTAAVIKDEHGNGVEADDTLRSILQAVADTIDHDLAEMYIFKVNALFFAVVHLNVNWSDPTQLYSFDAHTGKLNSHL